MGFAGQGGRSKIAICLILTAWTYGNGYVAAWLVMMLGLNPHRTGSLFALVGIVVGGFGIFVRHG
jgi:hypothetical protein